MKYHVFHAKHPTFGMGKPNEHPAFTPDNFEHVATVDSPTLGEVFRITNHIDHDWTTNSEVIWRKADGSRTRSTSVGDVVVVKDTNQRHRCEMVGWSEITNQVLQSELVAESQRIAEDRREMQKLKW